MGAHSLGTFLFKRKKCAQCAACGSTNNFFERLKMFTQANLMKLGITAGILWAGYKFAPNPAVKAMVLGVAGVVVAKNTPVLNTYVAV